MCRYLLSDMPGHLLVVMVEGSAALEILSPTGNPEQASPRLSLQPTRGMLRRALLEKMEPGLWGYVPDHGSRSVGVEAGEQGAVLLLISLAMPTWADLARFALQRPSSLGLSRPARGGLEPPQVLPDGAELQMLINDYRRHRVERQADVRRGRLLDLLDRHQIHVQTPLRVRKDIMVDVTTSAAVTGSADRLVRSFGKLPEGELITYTCLGRRWTVEASVRQWVDAMLEREDVFCAGQLTPPPMSSQHYDALVLCRAMVEHGLLQIERHAA